MPCVAVRVLTGGGPGRCGHRGGRESRADCFISIKGEFTHNRFVPFRAVCAAAFAVCERALMHLLPGDGGGEDTGDGSPVAL